MRPGYEQKLYVLAFDHRGSFQKKFFGIDGEPDPEQTAIIADAKHLIFEGLLQAVAAGADPAVTGVLVDEQDGKSARLNSTHGKISYGGLRLHNKDEQL